MIKAKFNVEKMSIRVGMLFSKLGFSPNVWTFGALVPAVLGFVYLYNDNLPAGTLLFFVAGLMDMIDGSVARVTGRVTNIGAFLDGVTDRYVELLLYLGLLFYGIGDFIIPASAWIVLLVFGAIMPSFVRAYADHRNVITEPEQHRQMGGLIERGERLMLLYVGMTAAVYSPVMLAYFVALTAILCNLTAFQRIAFVLKYKPQ